MTATTTFSHFLPFYFLTYEVFHYVSYQRHFTFTITVNQTWNCGLIWDTIIWISPWTRAYARNTKITFSYKHAAPEKTTCCTCKQITTGAGLTASQCHQRPCHTAWPVAPTVAHNHMPSPCHGLVTSWYRVAWLLNHCVLSNNLNYRKMSKIRETHQMLGLRQTHSVTQSLIRK